MKAVEDAIEHHRREPILEHENSTLFIQQLANQDRGVFPVVGMCVDDDDVAIQKKRPGRVFESPIRDKRRTIGESLVEQLGPLEIVGTEVL